MRALKIVESLCFFNDFIRRTFLKFATIQQTAALLSVFFFKFNTYLSHLMFNTSTYLTETLLPLVYIANPRR